jgi:voltage-gated sodium channel
MSMIAKLGEFVESARVQKLITWLIVINAAILGLETVPEVVAQAGGLLDAVDTVILTVFVIELVAKMAYRRLGFFREGWNWFDLIVVGIALVPAAGPLAVLRTLRVLRLLRLLSVVPSMRTVVEGLFRALPGMGSVAALFVLIFYVAAVLTTNLYGADFSEWFGDLGASMFTLFQIMTLEGWADMARSMMEQHTTAWIFFVLFILITTFAVLNLFVGIIVNAMQSRVEEEHAADAAQAHDERTAMLAQMEHMGTQLANMTADLAKLRQWLEENRARN